MKNVVGSVLVAVMAFLSFDARAACTAISQPVGSYLTSTNKCNFVGADLSFTGACAVGTTTVATLSPQCQIRQVPSSWGTWSSPPESESSTPRLCFQQGSMQMIVLDACASIAGTEVENNVFEPAMPVTVAFFDPSGTELIRITRDVLGRAGARLFAAQCDDIIIHDIMIVAEPSAQGFGFAQLRSNQFPAGGADDISPFQVVKPINPNAETNAE